MLRLIEYRSPIDRICLEHEIHVAGAFRTQLDRKQRIDVVSSMLEARHIPAHFLDHALVEVNGSDVQVLGVVALGNDATERIHDLEQEYRKIGLC